MNMQFQRWYAEHYEWIVQQFTDWAFTLTSSFLFYHDYDDLDEASKNTYRVGMAAFGGIALTYHIALFDKPTTSPTIVWDFHSLLMAIQLMFSFMLIDDRCGSVNTVKRLLLPANPIMYFVVLSARTSIMCISTGKRTVICAIKYKKWDAFSS